MSGLKSEGEKLLEVGSLSKSIDGVEILSNLTMEVKVGECFGILGENGSGKTSALRIISGLVFPNSGFVQVMGENPHRNSAEAMRHIGGFIGIPAFYPHLSTINNFRMLADGNKAPRLEQIMVSLDEVGLSGDADKKVEEYSRGMLQRLGLALALLDDKKIIMLDEPTQGVDEFWASKIVAIIKRKMAEGTSFIITTHDFPVVMELCKRVLVLEDGKTAYLGQLKEIAEFPYYYLLRCSPMDKAEEIVNSLPEVHRLVREDNIFELILLEEDASRVVKALIEAGCEINEMAKRFFSINDLLSFKDIAKKGEE